MGTKNAESTPCAQPGCRGRAEEEQDADHSYMECNECGYAFGFTRLDTPVTPDGPHPARRT